MPVDSIFIINIKNFFAKSTAGPCFKSFLGCVRKYSMIRSEITEFQLPAWNFSLAFLRSCWASASSSVSLSRMTLTLMLASFLFPVF